MSQTHPTTTPFSITYPTLEAAVSHLGEKVFGASIVIQPTAPTITYETESDPDILRAQRDGWEETAMQAQRNTDYYRGIVVQIGKALGPAAYRCADGSTSQDVLCAKVPELVAVCVIERDTFKTVAECLTKKK